MRAKSETERQRSKRQREKRKKRGVSKTNEEAEEFHSEEVAE